MDGWKENGKWIRKVKEGLQGNGIEEYDFEELEIKDIKKKTERLVGGGQKEEKSGLVCKVHGEEERKY